MLQAIAPANAWMIPSVGADFGKAMDQAAIAKSFSFPTVMALPMAGPTKPAGIATGLRRLSDVFGRPVIAYVRAENYLAPRDAAALIADGVVCSVKYAVERKNPAEDAYLSALIDAMGTARLASGMGERPAIVHWTKFGIRAFTSGSVAIAPHLSMAVLNTLKAGDVAAAERLREKFLPFEDLRDRHSQIVVLHDAVRLAGIADTGPIQPFLSGLEEPQVRPVTDAARALLEQNTGYARRQAA
jgi:dihydrodipicolinate synthase/N-acetylneuraminate lyase